jgi:bifunctional non-homologous end joining protein LigD
VYAKLLEKEYFSKKLVEKPFRHFSHPRRRLWLYSYSAVFKSVNLFNSYCFSLSGEGCLGERLTKVNFSNLGKILFPKLGITKGQVVEYYVKVAPFVLPLLFDRAVVLTRYPDGVSNKGFYEKDAPQGTPDWVKTVRIYSETAKRSLNYIIVNDLDTLVWLGNLAALEIHMPLSRLDAREKPDFVLFDIDPEPPADFEDSIKVALLLKEKLDSLGFESFVKTSGKKGLHVVIPIERDRTFRVTRNFAHLIGQHLAKEIDIVVSEFSDTKKPGTVFLDYTQNSHGRTMAIPYGLRATPEATVSTPIEWEEVKKGLKPEMFNLFTVVKRKKDPWNQILEKRQKLEVK